MTRVLNKEYKLILIDTNVLSEICKTDGLYLKFITKFSPITTNLLSYSPFTIFEISRNEFVYEKYKNQFCLLPSMIVKSNELLLKEEINNYYKKDAIDPVLLIPLQIKEGEKSGEIFNLNALHKLLDYDSLKLRFQLWESNIDKILKEYKGEYSFLLTDHLNPKKKVKSFVRNIVSQRLNIDYPDFVNRIERENDEIDVDKFPSLKMMAYLIYYKFYNDQRKLRRSDAMDIIISSSVPYADVFISEGSVISDLKKIKKTDNFLNNLELMTLREFKST